MQFGLKPLTSDADPCALDSDLSQNAQPLAENEHHPSNRLIGKVLAPAVQLWLRSQVESIEQLQVKIAGGNRQILSGHIPSVQVQAKKPVYQGLHLGEVTLAGTEIRINIAQVLKGHPLRLLQPFPVMGFVQLSQDDLNACLNAPLFVDALTELLVSLLQLHPTTSVNSKPAYTLENAQLSLDQEQLTICGQLTCRTDTPILLTLRTGLQVMNGHQLQFINTEVELPQHLPAISVEGFTLDLGADVNLQQLTLSSGQLICQGCLTVRP